MVEDIKLYHHSSRLSSPPSGAVPDGRIFILRLAESSASTPEKRNSVLRRLCVDNPVDIPESTAVLPLCFPCSLLFLLDVCTLRSAFVRDTAWPQRNTANGGRTVSNSPPPAIHAVFYDFQTSRKSCSVASISGTSQRISGALRIPNSHRRYSRLNASPVLCQCMGP